MNILISQVFDRLKSGDESMQQQAVVQILMLLERTLGRPEMDEELCAMLLSEDLLALHLSPNEAAEILDTTVSALNSTELLRSTKISLLGLVAKLADLKYAEVILQCFSEHAVTFNEQEAFSSVAQLTLFVMRAKHDAPRLRALLAKNNIVKHLEAFRTNPSPRLRQSAARLSDYLTSF